MTKRYNTYHTLLMFD